MLSGLKKGSVIHKITSWCGTHACRNHLFISKVLACCAYVLNVHNVSCIFILYSQGSEEAVRSMYQVVNKNSGLITKDPAHFLKALAAIDHKAQACGVALILYVIRD